MAPVLLSRAEKSYLLAGLGAKPAQRHDGRALTDVRPIEVDSHMSEQADGCARVTLGSTEVMCGVKLEMDSQEAPTVTVSQGERKIDFTPWLPSKPCIQVQVDYTPSLLREHNASELSMLTSTMQDMLQACYAFSGDSYGPLPARQFVVVPYAKYWVLHVDVYVMSWSGGNVLDTVFAAVFCALWNTRIPETRVMAMDRTNQVEQDAMNEDHDDPAGIKFITRGRKNTSQNTNAVDYALVNEWEHGRALEGREDVPVCVSVYPFQGTFLLDPTLEEECALSCSVAVLASSQGRLYGVRQRGEGELTLDSIHKATEVGLQYAKLLAQSLPASLPA